ncbi:MAG TPA: GWxTD domain-containing protein [Flavobacteriales bacterium]
MKNKFLLIAALIMLSSQVFALRAYFDYKVFNHPADGPYVEFVTSFDGTTFMLAPADSGLYMSKAELMIIISQNGNIVDYRKLNINGPLVEANAPQDFMSLERFLLPNGHYDVELEIKDLIRGGDAESFQQEIDIKVPTSGIHISDIQFISAYRKTTEENAFSKAGYDLIPYVSNYFPTEMNTIMFYSEIYGTDEVFGKGEPFVYTICVLDADFRQIESCKKIKREKSASVVPMIQNVNIAELPTGEYKLRLEIRNRENVVVYEKERSFSRSKIRTMPDSEIVVDNATVANSFAAQYTDRDQLYKLIEAHMPIAEGLDRITINNQLREADLQMLQSFLYTFWYRKDKVNPEAAWRAYEKQLKEVDVAFGNGKKPGWKTDRGRVYLQYGPPNTRAIRHNETNYFPFEIWHYYETNNGLHDRRFLFYSTDLSMDMELLHSDVPNEVQNYQWKEMVRSRPLALDMGKASNLNSNQKTDPFSQDELENLWFTPY